MEDDIGRVCTKLGEMMRKYEGKRLNWRPRNIWKESIRMDLSETRWEGVDWIHLAQDGGQWQHLVNMAMNLHIP